MAYLSSISCEEGGNFLSLIFYAKCCQSGLAGLAVSPKHKVSNWRTTMWTSLNLHLLLFWGITDSWIIKTLNFNVSSYECKKATKGLQIGRLPTWRKLTHRFLSHFSRLYTPSYLNAPYREDEFFTCFLGFVKKGRWISKLT